jgi:hypothetical protein
MPKYDPRELRLSETGDCPRKRVLKAQGKPVTHQSSDDALRTMETGNLWEHWLAERIGAVTPILPQVVVTTPYGASGHIDLLARIDGQELILEIKAVSQWTKVLPDPRHVQQVQAYLHFYGRQNGISRAQLLYIHRENGAGPFIHPITYDPAEGERIERELQALRVTIDAGADCQIPDGMQADQFPCSWSSRTGGGHCAYYGYCWGHGQG